MQDKIFSRIIPYTLLPETNICLRVELKGCRYKGLVTRLTVSLGYILNYRKLLSGNFFNNFLVSDWGRSQQSFLTNREYSSSSKTVSALIGVLTVAILVSIVTATILFHYKKTSLSKMNSFIRNRAGALKKISRTFDNNFSFSSSDEGETSRNTDRDSPAYSPEDNIEYTSVSIIRFASFLSTSRLSSTIVLPAGRARPRTMTWTPWVSPRIPWTTVWARVKTVWTLYPTTTTEFPELNTCLTNETTW